MNWFPSPDGELYAEQVSAENLARKFGTPTYVYSREGLEKGYAAYEMALADWPHKICYAVKANSNLAVLNVLAKKGAGFDIVSQGELERVLAAGGDPANVVFSGVGKQSQEIRRALEVNIHCFNVESAVELHRIQEEASVLAVKAPVSLRVNPDVDAQTHPYISTGLRDNKFGIDMDRALTLYEQAANMSNIQIIGVDCHIGSQLVNPEPFLDALERLLNLVNILAEKGIRLQHLDIGGGLGVRYADELPPEPIDYLKAVKQQLARDERYHHLSLIVEPGRSIAAQAGLLLTQVELIKHTDHKSFAVVDAAMNDLLRPSIYNAYHSIEAVKKDSQQAPETYDVVGPICESGDFLGKDRVLPICEGDLLAVHSVGAYGFSMSSNYNSRGRAAEVMVDKDQAYLIRRRETISDQLAFEQLLPEG